MIVQIYDDAVPAGGGGGMMLDLSAEASIS